MSDQVAGAAAQHELAQVNIARLRGPIDSELLAGFVALLDPVNALADAADGFLWRLQTEAGNATAIPAFAWDADDSAGVIVNLSVWRDLEALRAFTFGGLHREVLGRRREWFDLMREAYLACWWQPAGVRPTTEDAEHRIRLLRERGPTPDSFTLKEPYPPPTRS